MKSQESNTKVASTLVALRQKKSLSQREVAEAVGISSAALSLYELGNRQPSIDTLISLANFYCVSLDELCGRDTQTRESISGRDYLLSLMNLCEYSDGLYFEINVEKIPWHEDRFLSIGTDDAIRKTQDYIEEEEQTYGTVQPTSRRTTITIDSEWVGKFCESYKKYLSLLATQEMESDILNLWKEKRLSEVQSQTLYYTFPHLD